MVPRKLFRCIALVLFAGIIWSVNAISYVVPQNNRLKIVINPDWKYRDSTVTPVDPEKVTGSEAGWKSVNIPHCFNIPTWVSDHTYFGNRGWYRKHISIPASYKSRKVAIQFDGVFLHCWIYMNGTLVGEHKGGFTSFICDVTNQIKFDGSDNLLAVKVNSDYDPQIPPACGDFVFPGGIYRNVYLVMTDSLHVDFNGTFVTTPFSGNIVSSAGYTRSATFAKAPVKVQAEIKNSSSASKTYVVKNTIVDKAGQIVRSFQGTRTVAAGAIDTSSLVDTITSPHFWSLDDPYLYKVYTEVSVNGTVVDVYESPLGVRWFQYTTSSGFYLNGKQLYMRGFNIHQDHAGWSWAITNAGNARDVKMCKDVGARIIRGSHYPKDPGVVQACDSLGVCLMLESSYWGMGGNPQGVPASPATSSSNYAPFVANLKNEFREMIRSFRNNPSVIAYSLCNEPTEGQVDLNDLNSFVKAEDPTRGTSLTKKFTPFENNTQSAGADIIANNGSLSCGGGKPVFISEIGEDTTTRPGLYSAKSDAAPSCMVGAARWCGFDYATHHDNRGLKVKGMVDNWRIPKRRYYYFRNLWLGIAPPSWPSSGTAAKIALTSVDNKTTIKNDGTDDCQLMVTIQNAAGVQISKDIPVTIRIQSGSGAFPTGDTISMRTPDGLASIDFRSYKAGTTVLKTSSPGLPDATLSLTVINTVVDLSTTAIGSSSPSHAIPSSAHMQMHVRKGLRGLIVAYRTVSPHSTLSVFDLSGQLLESVALKGTTGDIHLDKSPVNSSKVVVIRLTDGERTVTRRAILGN